MNYSMFKGIAAFVIGSMLISCSRENSADVNQDRIYVEYELSYDKNTDKTFACAIFRFGNATGTQLELSAPAEVRFNGDIIPFDGTFAYYRKEYSGVVSSGTFTYTNTEGTTYTNSVSSTRTIAFPASLDTIHNSGSYTLAWMGDSVVANERVDVWMDGPQQNNAEYFTQYLASTSSIVLASNQLQALGTGATTITMERIWEEPALQVTSAGGKVRVKYKALNRTIQVIP